MLYVGDTKGFIHVIHPKLFEPTAVLNVAGKNVTGIAYEPGMLATTSTDSFIRLSRPTNPLINYTEIECHTASPVSV